MRFSTINELGSFIDFHSKLNTTAETLSFLRRNHTDRFIYESLEYCSIGNKLAIESLISKSVKEGVYISEDRPELEYKDVLESE